jgi:hypothetical protein
MSPIFFSNPPHFSVEWGTIPHNFEILDATLLQNHYYLWGTHFHGLREEVNPKI